MADKHEKGEKGEVKGDALETFHSLALTNQGAALALVIRNVLNHPNIFVFGEILNTPNVQSLSTQPTHRPLLELLRIFAYGTYSDYKSKQASLELPVLAAKSRELTKLKMLSIVEFASKHKLLSYRALQDALDVSSVRDLEDLIIDCVYQGLIQGKLDQRKNAFEVQWVMGRDLGPTEVDDMMKTLELWVNTSEALMKNLDVKIKQSNDVVDRRRREVADIAKVKSETIETIKVELQQGGPEAMALLLGAGGANAPRGRDDERRSKARRGAGGPIGSMMQRMLGVGRCG